MKQTSAQHKAGMENCFLKREKGTTGLVEEQDCSFLRRTKHIHTQLII